MKCSKNAATKLLIDKGLIKKNMELPTPLPTARLLSTIDRLTAIAKNKYGVDMGDLFKLRFRDVKVGDYLIQGSASVVTKIKIEPNEAAFEAIDRSPQQDVNHNSKLLNDYQHQSSVHDIHEEYTKIQEEGNFILSEDGEIQVPTSLPKINIQC